MNQNGEKVGAKSGRYIDHNGTQYVRTDFAIEQMCLAQKDALLQAADLVRKWSTEYDDLADAVASLADAALSAQGEEE